MANVCGCSSPSLSLREHLGLDSEGVSEVSLSTVVENINLQVFVPDLNVQKCIQVRTDEVIWDIKQKILDVLPKNLSNGFNYGFFLPPCNGRAGKFLLEERSFNEYPFTDCVPYVELKYKKRVYKMLKLDEKSLRHLHSKSNLKKFFEYVLSRQVEKVETMCSEGFDANVHDSRGETPLTLAASLPDCRDLILCLVNGGAHLDFRNLEGQTPLHRAALLSSHNNVKTLLELGASPNYKDCAGLTPLYYCMLRADTNANTAELLLRDFSAVDVCDSHGNQEIHQACKNGLVAHLEHLLFYGAQINAQNVNGNTPLHVCAVNDQESCARVLLFRGADATILNNQGQAPYYVAMITGHTAIAELLKKHNPQESVPFRQMPRYNSKRRVTWSRATGQLPQQLLRHQSVSHGDFSTLQSRRPRSIAPSPSMDAAFFSMDTATHTMPNDFRQAAVQTLKRKMSQPLDMPPPPGVPLVANGVLHALESVPSKPVNYASKTNTLPARKMSADAVAANAAGKRLSRNSSDVNIPRILVIPRGPKGFGFILRGAKKLELGVRFEPTPEIPALQYFEGVDMNGMAMKAGLRPGDFLLEINGEDVTSASHDEVVHLIQLSSDTISLKVITVIGAHRSVDESLSHFQTLPSRKRAPQPPRRAPTTSLSSTRGSTFAAFANSLAQLDEALAPYDDDGESINDGPVSEGERVASIRSRANSRRTSVVEIEEMMARHGSVSSEVSQNGTLKPKVYNSVSEMKRQKNKLPRGAQPGVMSVPCQPVIGPPPTQSLKSFGSSPDIVADTHLLLACPDMARSTLDVSDCRFSQDRPSSFEDDVFHGVHRRDSTDSDRSSIRSSAFRPVARPKTPPPPPPPPPPQMSKLSSSTSLTSLGPPPPAPPPPPPPLQQMISVDKAKSDCRGVTAEALSAVKLRTTATKAEPEPDYLTPSTQRPSCMSDQLKEAARRREVAQVESSSNSERPPATKVNCFDSDLRAAIAKRRVQLDQNKPDDTTKQSMTPRLGATTVASHVVFPGEVNRGRVTEDKERIPMSLKESVHNSMASTKVKADAAAASASNGSANGGKKESGYSSSRNSLSHSECSDDQGGLTALIPPEPINCAPELAPVGHRVSLLSQELEEQISMTRAINGPEKPRGFNGSTKTGNRTRGEQDAVSVTSTLSTLSGCSAVSETFSGNNGYGAPQRSSVQPVRMHDERHEADSGTGDSDTDELTPTLDRAGLGTFDAKPLATWAVADVCDWLNSLYLGEYVDAFAKARISGSNLLNFDRSQFTRLGVTRIAHRITIENSLKVYKPSTTAF